MTPTLIPCPFCGDAMQLWDQNTHARHIGDNGKCPLRHHAVMVDVWNTRAVPPSVAPIRLSADGPDQRPILGQRGVGLRAEPKVLELHTLDREEPIRVAVPDGEGFCRKCGAPMAEGIAMGQTYVGGMPDFPGDDHPSTFSAGGPGEVIRALKCTACGWSVT